MISHCQRPQGELTIAFTKKSHPDVRLSPRDAKEGEQKGHLAEVSNECKCKTEEDCESSTCRQAVSFAQNHNVRRTSKPEVTPTIGEVVYRAIAKETTQLPTVVSGKEWDLQSGLLSQTSDISKGKGSLCSYTRSEQGNDKILISDAMGILHSPGSEVENRFRSSAGCIDISALTETHTPTDTHTHTDSADEVCAITQSQTSRADIQSDTHPASPSKLRSNSRVSFLIPGTTTPILCKSPNTDKTDAEVESSIDDTITRDEVCNELCMSRDEKLHRGEYTCSSSSSRTRTEARKSKTTHAHQSYESGSSHNQRTASTNSTTTNVSMATGGKPSCILNEGSNTVNNSKRGQRVEEGRTLAKFAAKSFWMVLLTVTVVTVPFMAVLLAYLFQGDVYLCECNPVFALSVTMVSVSGFIHCLIIWFYAWQVLKHRQHPAIKPRGQHFLKQLCGIGCVVPVMATLNSLVYLGALQGICIFSYTGQACANSTTGETTTSIYYTTWTRYEGLVLQLVHVFMRLTTTIYFAAVIARQRILYILFVGTNRTRTYTSKQMLWQYLYPNIIILVCWLISEVVLMVFVVEAFHDGEAQKKRVDITVGLCLQIGLVLGMLGAFCFYAHMTRNLELVFSDYWSNVRVISIFTVVSVAISIARLVSGTTVVVGLLYGPLEMAFVTLYFMDSFTAALIHIHHGIERVSLPSAPSFVVQALRKRSTAATPSSKSYNTKSNSLDREATQESQSVPTEL